MRIAVIIPTYNERENIARLIPAIFTQLGRGESEVIVVDDSSPDGTSEVVKELQKRYPIKLIIRAKKLGLGSAYVRGFKEGLKNGSELFFQMDGDLSHHPKYLPKFLQKVKGGCDVVIGSRLVRGGGVSGWEPWRKAISRCGNLIGRHIAGIDVLDLTSGYRLYTKEVLESVDLNKVQSKSYDFQLEMLARAIKRGFKVCTIPIIFYGRAGGRSKLSKTDQIKFLITALKIRLGVIR